MNKLYILGNGSFAQEVFEQIIVANQVKNFGGFIILKDDKAFCIGEEGAEAFTYPPEAQLILGTANPQWRTQFYNHFLGYYELNINHWPNMSAPNSYQSLSSTIGIGNLFLMFSLVNANTQVGNFNLLCTFTSISVNCAIGNHNVLSPYSSISKNVCIENSNLLESGEILFEDLESDCILTNGVVYAND